MNKTIVIIEDDPDILDLMTYILQDEGYQVIAAVDSEPLKDIHLNKPDLILMDNRLEVGVGSSYCRKLKSDPLTSTIPIVLISANMGLEQMAMECRADQFLCKPFDINELIDKVKQFVS